MFFAGIYGSLKISKKWYFESYELKKIRAFAKSNQICHCRNTVYTRSVNRRPFTASEIHPNSLRFKRDILADTRQTHSNIGPATGLLLSRECLSHDTTFFSNVRTNVSMLWRGSNIRVKVIAGTRTTLSGAYYIPYASRFVLQTSTGALKPRPDDTSSLCYQTGNHALNVTYARTQDIFMGRLYLH